MKNYWLFRKENLFARIAIGFAIGILLGLFAPGFSISTRIVGDIYLKLIKFMVLPVLVCAVMTGIINSANIKSLRRVAVKTVVLFFVMFLASFAVSSVVAMSIRPGQGIVFENQPVYEGTIAGKLSAADVLRQLFPGSLEDIFSSKNILVTIILAIILAVVIVRMGEKAEHVKDFINRLSDIVFRILSVIMETSPIGVMSLIAFSIAEYGAGLFMAIGKYILCCWLACLAVFIIVFMWDSISICFFWKSHSKSCIKYSDIFFAWSIFFTSFYTHEIGRIVKRTKIKTFFYYLLYTVIYYYRFSEFYPAVKNSMAYS